MNMVRYKQNELPALTEERKAELMALAKRPDNEIDYSDIPTLDEGILRRALRSLEKYRAAAALDKKEPITEEEINRLVHEFR